MNTVKILLSGQTSLPYYVDAVHQAGGIATAQYLPEINTDYDGLILCGGGDIDPSYYHEEVNGSVAIDLARDNVEFALLEAYIRAGKPVLGICRGFQLINIYFGGTLHQDIPETNIHAKDGDQYRTHTVTAMPNSLLYRFYGPSMEQINCDGETYSNMFMIISFFLVGLISFIIGAVKEKKRE